MKQAILIFSLISVISAFHSISLSTCKMSKACFKMSKGCSIDECQYIVTWKTIKKNDKQYLEIEMVGKVSSQGGFIAIGFSTDKAMGDDGVVTCISDPVKGVVNVMAGFNEPSMKLNVMFSESELDADFFVKTDGNKYGGSFSPSIKRISCRFLRLLTPELNKEKLKDLGSGNSYYLLVARGVALNPNKLQKHSAGTTVVSDVKIDFSSASFHTVVGSSQIAKAHGVLMIIVWICCCSVSIILARYYKDTWLRNTNKTEGKWFNSHRSLQAIGFILLVISLILIFVHVGGYSKLDESPLKYHPILGLIASILFLINPFIALCRCDSRHRKRPIFNWIHFIVGTVAYILSIPTIMIGLRLPAAGTELSRMSSVQWIVFFFVIFQFLVELILEIHACKVHPKNEKKRIAYEEDNREYERAIQKGHNKTPQPLYPRQSGRIFKLIILGIYIIVTLCVAVALILLIIRN